MRKPIVWAVREQMVRNQIGSNAMDYTGALPFGELKFITKNDMPMHPASSVMMNWDMDVAKFVREYDESKDFIIATGQPTAIFAIGHALGVANKDPRYLVWRREENRYRVLDTLPF